MFKNLILLIVLSVSQLQAQFPWENPLVIAHSSDGITFNNSTVFQDSSGVPSAISWKGDTLICVFQWFRLPNPSASWDKVAVKFSYDNGISWTEPTPIIINGIPTQYQRPFDPTLVKLLNSDSLRIYYSSSDGIPMGGLDSTVNTYSALSADGINFNFEPNPRVDVLNRKVIDPAVVYFNNSWHYTSPIGAPQDGANHYVSPNGINFSAAPVIASDNSHNWTGNFVVEDSTELRFYGSGPIIWYNSTANGGLWNGFINTNIQGGDPTVVKLSDSSYIMIYVGAPNFTALNITDSNEAEYKIYPNPTADMIYIQSIAQKELIAYRIYNSSGQLVQSGKVQNNSSIGLSGLKTGLFLLQLGAESKTYKIIKQ
jgi:hypothetical protein